MEILEVSSVAYFCLPTGLYKRAVLVQKYLVKHFPKAVEHQNQLAILLILSNRLNEAKDTLSGVLSKWPNNGTAMVHYGFVLKQLGEPELSVDYLRKGISTNENGTLNGLFYLTLGDTLIRLGQPKEAHKVRPTFLKFTQSLIFSTARYSLKVLGKISFYPHTKDLCTMYRASQLSHFGPLTIPHMERFFGKFKIIGRKLPTKVYEF